MANKIEHGSLSTFDLGDESGMLGHRANRKLFGVYRFHLRTYQTGQRGLEKGKDSTWLRNSLVNIGEPPVLVDSSKCELSVKRLQDHYFNLGFLNAQVTYEIRTSKVNSKKAKVIYHVELGEVKRINSVKYVCASKNVNRIVDSLKYQSPLIPGQRLDFSRIQGDRNRITHDLKNHGYYYFNSSYVDYSLDTNIGNNLVDIVVNVRNQMDDNPHEKQTINRVVVLVGIGANTDTIEMEGLKFIHNSYYIDDEFLAQRILIRPGDTYKINAVSKTYSDLLAIGLFRFVTIRFSSSGADSSGLLDVEIILQTAQKHDISWEPQVIYTEHGGGIQSNSERNLGVGNTISLNNRNVFGSAEALNFRTSTALEFQLKNDNNRSVSSFRQSTSMEFILPSLLFFEQNELTRNYTNRSTRFTVSYLYENNQNYQRHVLPFTYTYNFTREHTIFAVTPFRLSYNSATVSPAFIDDLDPASKEYVEQLLTNNIITGPVISLYWNNGKKRDNMLSIRSNIFEVSGLSLAGYHMLKGNSGLNKEFLGVKYSQYTRSDIDISFNQRIDQNNRFVYRLNIGLGLPFGNSEFLPFERRFFVGGANSLRAWRPRSIGPGEYTDESTISVEKTGEILVQMNWEYRFTVIDNLLEGAVFADAGNIWNFKNSPSFDGGEFLFNEFYRQLAFNSGIGTRWDLSYLIFRIDWGIALHDPSVTANDHWVIRNKIDADWIRSNSALNFAVGYPF